MDSRIELTINPINNLLLSLCRRPLKFQLTNIQLVKCKFRSRSKIQTVERITQELKKKFKQT